ncbi:undecaprenyl-diphosphate phosphatase [Allorhodopirellula heiligendammensis]|uniref:Undecaprenyl-diphosphatase n=1 Tax=Allorhodopirellula heiligendammensis TaxID=2714739 RepID=A0A5C6BV04_9BACT|nr:undecaprenyl-diphosphate phosphatase [Allorhodopirellula heiligendammensis]TWU16110.1 Undecaprenyl-diphosphatase [Allorhodopirellula heiligendammensis]
MTDLLRVFILAVVQGIAEFLPISSSGHLVILNDLLGGLDESATLVIILHAGTLGSILVVYWRRILDLLTRDRRVIGLMVVGTVPAVVIGLTIKKGFPWLTESPAVAAPMLILTGILLLGLGKLPKRAQRYTQLSWMGAFVVGCFQAVAILPGISRSGSTIFAGRLLGLSKEDSVTFSFLLAIPAICGAVTLAIKDLVDGSEAASELPLLTLLIGALVAFLVGIAALKWLIRWSQEDRLHWFAYWCIPVGAVFTLYYWGGLGG